MQRAFFVMEQNTAYSPAKNSMMNAFTCHVVLVGGEKETKEKI